MWQRPYLAARTPVSPLPARFQLGELLGRGTGTEVYSAHDRLLNMPVAVKLFPADPDPESCRRVADEARALYRLDHDGLVSVLDGGLHRSRPYLVMQLIPGHSLSAALRGGALSIGQVVPMATLLADALGHVHSRGVVHRDVKPSNIMLDEHGVPHLGDFGIALLAGQARLTRADEIIGTPAYLAPEQIRGRSLTPAVDVYALGLVVLECLTGQREYADANKIKAALARLDRRPRIPTGLPAGLAQLLRGMTEDDPARRPSADACAEALKAIMRSLLAVSRPALAHEARTVRLRRPAGPGALSSIRRH
ncbi:MAG TPA: serine/threonine-protein kinase [Pseudonocardiaceae bacterium]|jgi:serine/threonine protein kinase|nr:serine/threonine-protein kinase [Pseudonocardiaceae bacterium]